MNLHLGSVSKYEWFIKQNKTNKKRDRKQEKMLIESEEFSRKWRKPLNFPRPFLLHLIYLKNFLEVCQKSKSNLLSDWILVQGQKLLKFCWWMQSHFYGKTRKTLTLSKTFFSFWSWLETCFYVCQVLKLNFWVIECCARLKSTKFDPKIEDQVFLETNTSLETFQKLYKLVTSINLFQSASNT